MISHKLFTYGISREQFAHLMRERSLHTGEVVGSIPTAPTVNARVSQPFCWLATQDNSERNEA